MHFIFLLTICCISIIVHMQKIDADKKRKQEVIFIGITLFLFAALRDKSVGTDILGYCNNYKINSNYSFLEILSGQNNYRDPFFQCFTRALAYISDDPQIMLIVVGAWVAFSYSYFTYHSKGNVLITYLLFICLRMYSFTLSGLRQAMAMGFVWIAFVFLMQNKKWRFLIFVLIASLFHASAIAFLLAFPLIYIKEEKIVLVSTFFISLINFVTGDKIVYYMSELLFSRRFEDYIDTAIETGTSFSTTFILYILMLLIILLFFSKVKKQDEKAVGKFNLMCVGIMFSFIAQGFPNMFRIAYYFIFNLFPLFSETITFSFNEKDRTVLNVIVPVLLIGQYLIMGTSAGTENYVFFWQG